jgi:hypothetical protein
MIRCNVRTVEPKQSSRAIASCAGEDTSKKRIKKINEKFKQTHNIQNQFEQDEITNEILRNTNDEAAIQKGNEAAEEALKYTEVIIESKSTPRYVCEFCNRGYPTEKSLNRHTNNVHSGLKPN